MNEYVKDIGSIISDYGWKVEVAATGLTFIAGDFSFTVKGDTPDAVTTAVRDYALKFDANAYAKGKAATSPNLVVCVEAAKAFKYDLAYLAAAVVVPKLDKAVSEWLAENRSMYATPGGAYDYVEEFPDDGEYPLNGAQLTDMLEENKKVPNDPTPRERFYTWAYTTFDEGIVFYRDQLVETIKTALLQGKVDLPEDPEDIYTRAVETYLVNHYDITPPYKFFLHNRVPVAIVIDTGDGASDFTLNCCHAPHYSADGDPFSDKASLVWLTKQQGYTTEQLEQAMSSEKNQFAESTYLGSLYILLENCHSETGALSVLVDMSVEQAFLLEALSRLSHAVDDTVPARWADVGTITLSKDSACDLIDYWDGSGTSGCEIHLDRDIELPIKYIHWVRPDTEKRKSRRFNYDPTDIYDVDRSMYKPTIKDIQFPDELRKQVSELIPDFD